MSKDYPCVYWNDGKCKKFSDDKVTSWCVWNPCDSQTPSNADKIRSMSDEELAQFLNQWGTSTRAWQKDKGETMCWLQQPAEEG